MFTRITGTDEKEQATAGNEPTTTLSYGYHAGLCPAKAWDLVWTSSSTCSRCSILLAEIESFFVRLAGQVEAVVGAQVEAKAAGGSTGQEELLQLGIQGRTQTHFVTESWASKTHSVIWHHERTTFLFQGLLKCFFSKSPSWTRLEVHSKVLEVATMLIFLHFSRKVQQFDIFIFSFVLSSNFSLPQISNRNLRRSP